MTGARQGVDLRYRPEDFEADGALRDVCILDADADDWRRVFVALDSTSWEFHFSWTLSGESRSDLPGVAEVFQRLSDDPDESAKLSIRVGSVWFACYFFDVEEIEFTFDPCDVTDQGSFSCLEQFIRCLGDSTGKRVIVTMETASGHAGLPALLEYP